MAGEALALALNRLISLDPDLPGELAGLAGRRFQLTWAGPEWTLQARVDNAQIRIEKPTSEPEPDFSLRTSLAGLAGLLRPEAKGVLPVGKVQISGDADLLRSLETLAKRYQPDLEVRFAERLGPVFGPQVARLLQSVFNAFREQGRQAVLASAEYVLYEGELVPTRELLEDFAADVDQLRDDVERFEARLARLSRT
ncbi:SCP2 domain-containing protein [Ahniella affigens]|uniref:Ubiquinone biosynthesis accessory factor UbiJ n=1 Tax=Ahniella affigens TaxID=2021234 RepID=A0A2P1PT59_9GAMM|nr:SCP2 sterol-binding domain-containing protein [Ahniella affigens]AVP98035.1 SCP2 domain-containing protein [Ahniella affigens]